MVEENKEPAEPAEPAVEALGVLQAEAVARKKQEVKAASWKLIRTLRKHHIPEVAGRMGALVTALLASKITLETLRASAHALIDELPVTSLQMSEVAEEAGRLETVIAKSYRMLVSYVESDACFLGSCYHCP